MPDSFSQRHGLGGPPLGTLVRDEVPVSFKMFLINLPHAHVGLEYEDVRKVTCDVLQEYPDDNLPPYYDYRRHIKQCPWFRIYEIIEGLFKIAYGKDYNAPYPRAFVKAINDAFVAQNIGWQLDFYGKVVARGDEVFENTLNTSDKVLREDAKPTAAQHLRNAINALSARPISNTSGAVSDATKAVECVLGEITGQVMTLGKYLDKYPSLFRPALKKGLDGIYGYASDEGARHGKEGTVPASEEAEFVIAICAATCTLLTRKRPK